MKSNVKTNKANIIHIDRASLVNRRFIIPPKQNLFSRHKLGSPERARLVFSLNFSSAGKGPFMTSKAKNMCQRCTFPGGRGLVV